MRHILKKKILVIGFALFFACLSFGDSVAQTTFDLGTIAPDAIPAGAALEWHSDIPVNASNLLSDVGAVGPGLYYAVFNFGAGCYSVPSPYKIIAADCAGEADITMSVESGTIPDGSILTYHSSSPATDANRLDESAMTATGVGTYYVAYYNSQGACYSNASPIRVIQDVCPDCLLEIGGTVYLDLNGLSDGINGTVINGATSGLYISLVQGNSILNTVGVKTDGTYLFKGVIEGEYKLVLGNSSTGMSSSTLPGGLFYVGEGGNVDQLSGNSKGDRLINGLTMITATCNAIEYLSARTAATVIYNHIDFALSTSPLPVTLISFAASRTTEGVMLKWRTSEEHNFERFDVERSYNPRIGFSTVTSVPGGQYNYSLTDHVVPVSVLYYRLRMVDTDGSTAYSKIVSVSGDGNEDEHFAYPNPSVDRQVFIRSKVSFTDHKVFDSNGKQIPAKVSATSDGYQIILEKTAYPGAYTLTYRYEGQTMSKKFVLEN